MESEIIKIPYGEFFHKVDGPRCDELRFIQLYKEMGLRHIKTEANASNKWITDIYFELINKELYFLAKIKYGF